MFIIDKEGGDFIGIVIGELFECIWSIVEWPLRNLTDFLEETVFALLGVGGTGAS